MSGKLKYIAVLLIAAFASAADVTVLTSGSGLEREIRGGETHTFRIQATAGQFVQIEVEQKGIDVTARLTDPAGRQLAQSDLPNGEWGPESIARIVDAAGEYGISVSVPNAKAPPGKYEIRVLALRDPSPEDRERAAAEATLEAAQALRQKHTGEARLEAIDRYQTALRFFEKSGDRYRQGLVRYLLGVISVESGDMRQALTFYERATQLFHEIGDQRGEANATNSAGGAYDVLGEPQKARRYYEQALAVYRSLHETLSQGIELNNIGKLDHDRGDWQKAIEYYRGALPLFRAAGDQRREAIVLGNLGTTYNRLGATVTALDYFQESLKIYRAAGDRIGQANALSGMGMSYSIQNQLREAASYFEQALALYRAAGDRRHEDNALNLLGVSYGQLGDAPKALEFLQQALGIARTTGDRAEEAAVTGNIGGIYAMTGDSGKALEYSSQALAIARAIGDRDREAKMLQAQARAQRDLGNLMEARRQVDEALAVIENVRSGAGAEESRASFLASKQDAYGLAIDILMELHSRDVGAGLAAAALETTERSRARSMLDMLAESGTSIRQGVDTTLLDREREITNTLNAKGARLLPLARTAPRAVALQKEIRDLESQYQDVEAAIRKNSPGYAALAQPSPLKVSQIQQELLDEDTLLLEYSLGEKRSYLWTVAKNDLHAWELPARGKIEAQVEQVTELLTARSVAKRLETPAERQKRIAQADASLAGAARELSRMVIGPAEGVLGGKKLVIVPDGALQRLPFSMLPIGGSPEPLIVSHEVVMLPSASALALLRQEVSARKPASKTIAVFADPVFDRTDPRAGKAPDSTPPQPSAEGTRILEHLTENGDGASGGLKISRLPYTAQEADQILNVARSGANLKAVGFQANRTAAISGQLSDYRYLHFATHGYLDTERPSLSALVLSQIDERNQPEDGFLRVNDIYNMRLTAELVVLSACQTGLGKEVRGEGLMGLTRAFLYAGAPRVIVSLWNVNDRATADLMTRLYRGMLREGKTPAAALREAQLEMRKQKRWESPYYWAAFVQHGEWKSGSK